MNRLLLAPVLGRALAVIGLLLVVAAPAHAGLRFEQLQWMPQGDVVADGYELHLHTGDYDWVAVDIGFLYDVDGIVSFLMPLNDDRDYEIAVSAYIWDGDIKLSSPLSNVRTVAATFHPECTVNADCSDGDVCNGAETCVWGTCKAGTSLVCDDPGPCQAAVCDAQLGCTIVDDPNDPACQPSPDPECTVDADCSDGDVCNGAESCVSGVCMAGTSLVCDDPGPCQAAVCDAQLGCTIVDDPNDPACQPEGDPQSDVTGVSVDLDGLGEQLGTSSEVALGINGGFSISLWVEPLALDERMTLLDAYTPGDDPDVNRIEIYVRGDLPGDPIHIETHDYRGSVIQAAEFDDRLAVGRWTHILMTHKGDGTQLKVHVDGVRLTPSRVLVDRRGFMGDRPRELVLGADYSRLANFLRGRLGHAAMWSRRLGSSQAESIAAAGFDADLREVFGAYNPDNLEHYWRLGEDLGQIGADWILDAPVDLDQTVDIDASDVVADAP